MLVATGVKALGRRGRHALSRRLGDDQINTGTTLARRAGPPDRKSGPPYAAARRVAESTSQIPHVSPVETGRVRRIHPRLPRDQDGVRHQSSPRRADPAQRILPQVCPRASVGAGAPPTDDGTGEGALAVHEALMRGRCSCGLGRHAS
jgi:hypothetical protein